MQLWTQPTATNKRLYLPLFNSSNLNINQASIRDELSVAFNDASLRVWERPSLKSDKEIAESLALLLKPISELIFLGQSLVSSKTKEHSLDIVTEMDLGVEMILRSWFSKHLPTHKIIGEETDKELLGSDDIIWYIDPIDGTYNYSRGASQYCLLIGSTKQSSPYISAIALPHEKRIIVDYPGSDRIAYKEERSDEYSSEFLVNQVKQNALQIKLNQAFDLRFFSNKSIGITLYEILMGRALFFYKAFVKPWDVMAPLAFLEKQGHWDIQLLTLDGDSLSPFSHDESHIAFLNERFKQNCRIGLLTVTPKNRPDIKRLIIEEFLKL